MNEFTIKPFAIKSHRQVQSKTQPYQSPNTVPIADLQSHLLNLWTSYSVDDTYQNLFLVYIETFSNRKEQAKQIEREIKKTYQKSSLYFLLQENIVLRTEIKQQIEEQIQKESENSTTNKSSQHFQSSLKQLCDKLKNLRRINLLIAENIIKIFEDFKVTRESSLGSIGKKYIEIFTQIDQENSFIKDSFLNQFILFQKGYDPFFLVHYEEIMKSPNPKTLKKHQPVSDLFDMNISYVYRLMRAQQKMLKYLLLIDDQIATDKERKQLINRQRIMKINTPNSKKQHTMPQSRHSNTFLPSIHRNDPQSITQNSSTLSTIKPFTAVKYRKPHQIRTPDNKKHAEDSECSDCARKKAFSLRPFQSKQIHNSLKNKPDYYPQINQQRKNSLQNSKNSPLYKDSYNPTSTKNYETQDDSIFKRDYQTHRSNPLGSSQSQKKWNIKHALKDRRRHLRPIRNRQTEQDSVIEQENSDQQNQSQSKRVHNNVYPMRSRLRKLQLPDSEMQDHPKYKHSHSNKKIELEKQKKMQKQKYKPQITKDHKSEDSVSDQYYQIAKEHQRRKKDKPKYQEKHKLQSNLKSNKKQQPKSNRDLKQRQKEREKQKQKQKKRSKEKNNKKYSRSSDSQQEIDRKKLSSSSSNQFTNTQKSQNSSQKQQMKKGKKFSKNFKKSQQSSLSSDQQKKYEKSKSGSSLKSASKSLQQQDENHKKQKQQIKSKNREQNYQKKPTDKNTQKARQKQNQKNNTKLKEKDSDSLKKIQKIIESELNRAKMNDSKPNNQPKKSQGSQNQKQGLKNETNKEKLNENRNNESKSKNDNKNSSKKVDYQNNNQLLKSDESKIDKTNVNEKADQNNPNQKSNDKSQNTKQELSKKNKNQTQQNPIAKPDEKNGNQQQDRNQRLKSNGIKENLATKDKNPNKNFDDNKIKLDDKTLKNNQNSDKKETQNVPKNNGVNNNNNTNSNNQAKQSQQAKIKIVPGKISIKYFPQYIKSKQIHPSYANQFKVSLQFILKSVQKTQTYLNEFHLNDQLAVVALCSPTSSGNMVIYLWAPIDKVCDEKQSLFFFKKYIDYIENQTTFKAIMYGGEEIPELKGQGFEYQKDRYYLRKRVLDIKREDFEFQYFFSMEATSISFFQSSIQSLLYSDQITPFSQSNSWCNSTILMANPNALSEKFKDEWKVDLAIKSIHEANALLQKESYDTFEVGEEKIKFQNINMSRCMITKVPKYGFIANQGFMIVGGKTLTFTQSKKKVSRMSLLHDVNLYFGSEFKTVAEMALTLQRSKQKAKQQQSKFAFKMFSKQLYGKYILKDDKLEKEKAYYCNWDINFAWRDQIPGKIVHDVGSIKHKYGPQQFILVVQMKGEIALGAEILPDDFLY